MTSPRLCFYCSKPMRPKGMEAGQHRHDERTTDHIVPVSKINWAITQEWRNLDCVQCCHGCNNRKSDMWPLDWLEIMPEAGVARLIERLLRLGCEQTDIDAHMEARNATGGGLRARTGG